MSPSRALLLALASASLTRGYSTFVSRRRPKLFSSIEADRAAVSAALALEYLDKAVVELEKIDALYKRHYPDAVPPAKVRVNA